MELDGIQLNFEEDALREVARLSNKRKTGARGLRSILEGSMMDYMYELPSQDDIKEFTITKEDITGDRTKALEDKNVPVIEDTHGETDEESA